LVSFYAHLFFLFFIFFVIVIDNSPTNQLAVSQVADFVSTRRKQNVYKSRNYYTVFAYDSQGRRQVFESGGTSCKRSEQ